MTMPEGKYTVRGYKFNHFAINWTVAMAAEARVNPALPSTAMVEFMAKWSNLSPRTVIQKVKKYAVRFFELLI